MKKHEVNVYDKDGNILEVTIEGINVEKIVRFEHLIGDEITYSFNTHYTNGLMHFGEVPYPSFKDAKLKLTTE
jgi:hypothetical protein